ncbi:MAG: YmdB family metallophosphoesterase [Clostridia bacterium]|nr:YmdB family metallophosphoesterase [Clostridia bacterium]
MLNILAVGDVFGEPGCKFVQKHLRAIKNREKADLVIVNAENAAAGSGLDREEAQLLFDSGADVLTGGNHSFRRYAAFELMEENGCILRPLNFPAGAPGNGSCIVTVKNGIRVLVISVCGQVMMDPVDSPFYAVDRLLEAEKGRYDVAVCDLHAEATSEKQVFAAYFDGRIKVIFGTHTHVQTADERLTDRGGAFITDVGMCGGENSVIGLTYGSVYERYITNIRRKGIADAENVALCGAVFTLDDNAGYVTGVKRIKYTERDF